MVDYGKREPFRLVDLAVFCSTNPEVISSRIFEREQLEEVKKKKKEKNSAEKLDELSMKIDTIVKREKEFQSTRQSRGRLLYTSPIRVQIFLTKKKKKIK